MTDTSGNILAVVVHAANIHDTKSGISPAREAYVVYPTIEKFCGDQGYQKSFIEMLYAELGVGVDISERTAPQFVVLPSRSAKEMGGGANFCMARKLT